MTTSAPTTPPPPTPDPLERRLRGALLPHRPDAEDFLAGVRERVAAREAVETESRERRLQRWRRAPALLRSAASFLPPALLPAALKAAGFVAKPALSWKTLPGLAALPVVSLVMLVAGFVAGLRSLRHAGAPTEASAAEQAELVRAWWERNRWPALGALALVAALAFGSHPETAVVVVLVSLAATVALLGFLGRAGITERRQVGAILGQSLFHLGLTLHFLRDLFPSPAPDLPLWLGPWLLALAGAACLVAGGILTPRKVWARLLDPVPMRHPDPVTTWSLRALAFACLGIAASVLLIAAWVGAAAFVPIDASRARLAASLEAFDAPLADAAAWARFERVAEAFGDEATDLDLARAAEVVNASLAKLDLDGPAPLAPGVGTALRLGLVDAAHVAALAESRAAERLLLERGPSLHGHEAVLQALVATERLAGAHLERVLARELAEERTRPDHGRLARLLALGRLADSPATRRALEPLVRDALARHWDSAGSRRGTGGFRSSPDSSSLDERAFFGNWRFEVDPTLDGIALVRRFGTPPEVDPERLRVALAAQVHRAAPPIPWLRSDDVRAEAGLFALREAGLVQPRPWWRTLLRWRTVLGASLLGTLALVATLRAPKGTEDAA